MGCLPLQFFLYFFCSLCKSNRIAWGEAGGSNPGAPYSRRGGAFDFCGAGTWAPYHAALSERETTWGRAGDDLEQRGGGHGKSRTV